MPKFEKNNGRRMSVREKIYMEKARDKKFREGNTGEEETVGNTLLSAP